MRPLRDLQQLRRTAALLLLLLVTTAVSALSADAYPQSQTRKPLTKAEILAFVADLLREAKQAADSLPDIAAKGMTWRDVASAYAKAGDIPSAQQIAASLPRLDDKRKDLLLDRADVLLAIADAQTAFRDRDNAKKTLQEARQLAANDMFSFTGLTRFLTIAKAQLRAGDTAGAKSAVLAANGTIQQEAPQSVLRMLLPEMVGLRIAAEDPEGATQMLSGITGAGSIASALQYMAQALADRGDVAEALNTARKTATPSFKIDALLYIATVQAKAGNRAGALQSQQAARESMKGLKDSFDITYAYLHLAEAQAETGNTAGEKQSVQLARTSVESVDAGTFKVKALVNVADALLKLDDKPGAVQVLQSAKRVAGTVTAGYDQDDACAILAPALARAGDLEGARQTAARLTNRYRGRAVYRDIAHAQTRTGDVDGAHKRASAAPNKETKIQALLGIVDALLEKAQMTKP